MAETNIGWTDAVWNPTTGCTKISPGCKHCYAETMHRRLTAMGLPKYAQPFNVMTCHEDALDAPLHWKKPRRIFVNSMSDLFHEDVPDDFIAEVFGVMAVAGARVPGSDGKFSKRWTGETWTGGHGPHEFQILTKRTDRMEMLVASHNFRIEVSRAAYRWSMDRRDAGYLSDCIYQSIDSAWLAPGRSGRLWPLPNVWLGVSAENQEQADKRIPALLRTPAALRFVSVEPMLGPVDLRCLQHNREFELDALTGDHGVFRPLRGRSDRKLSWVICGCESGPNRRPTDIKWVRSLRDQCADAGVPFFLKQMEIAGKVVHSPYLDGVRHEEFPEVQR